MKKNGRYFFFMAGVLLLSAACSVGPDFHHPETPEKKEWHDKKSVDLKPIDVIRLDWWKDFNDPYLDKLIRDALNKNYNLKILLGHIRTAGAFAEQASGRLLPAVDVDTSATFSRHSSLGSSEQINTHANVQWELDLWGKGQKEKKAAVAELKASEADFRAGYLKLVAEIGNTFFLIRQLDGQTDYSQRFEEKNNIILKIYEDQYAKGIVSNDKVIRQKSLLNDLQQDRLEMQRYRRELEHRLATLSGISAGTLQITPRHDDTALPEPTLVPLGLPATLLQRRPDLLAAEYRVLKAVNLVGQAKAAQFPTISLTATGGFASTALTSLISGGLIGITPQLFFPFFDGGVRKQQVVIRKTEAEIAADNYCQVVLLAFEEVENALNNLESRKQQRNVLNTKIDHLEEIHGQTLARLEVGLISQLEIIDIEQALYSAQKSLLALRYLLLEDTVTLYKALGGGWPIEQVN